MIMHYIKAGIMLAFAATIFGWAVPALLSAASDLAVLAGIGLAFVGGVPMIAYGKRTYKRIKAHVDREDTKRELGV